jgi:hypothetical protein
VFFIADYRRLGGIIGCLQWQCLLLYGVHFGDKGTVVACITTEYSFAECVVNFSF